MSNVLEIRGLTKHYPVGGAFARSLLHAADDVSLSIAPGETVGLVGESGSGKSTVGRCILRLEEPTSGEILLNGESVVAATSSRLRVMRANMQMVFQDPYDSLNPRIKVGELVAEPLWLSGIMSRKEADRKVAEVFDLVHLPTDTPLRYAHQLSGGQQQRVGIARALATNPDLVVLDEPTSALDVSVQAQIINLLEEIRQRLSPAYLFISHDLSVVEQYRRPRRGDVSGADCRGRTHRHDLRTSGTSLYPRPDFCRAGRTSGPTEGEAHLAR